MSAVHVLERPEPRAKTLVRQDERDAVRVKLVSEQRRRQAFRVAMLRSPQERQREVEECAAMSFPDPDAELAGDENAQDHEGESLRGAVAWELARASEYMGVPLPVDASSLAVAWLTAHDLTFGTDVEGLPSHAVTPGRLWGHLYQVGLAIDPQLAASAARRVMPLLLSSRRGTVGAAPRPRPKAEVTLQPVPLPENRFQGAPAPPEPTFERPPRTHERRVVAYVKLRETLAFHGVEDLPAEEVVEQVEALETESTELARSRGAGRAMLLVWWRGKPRYVPTSAVERIG